MKKTTPAQKKSNSLMVPVLMVSLLVGGWTVAEDEDRAQVTGVAMEAMAYIPAMPVDAPLAAPVAVPVAAPALPVATAPVAAPVAAPAAAVAAPAATPVAAAPSGTKLSLKERVRQLRQKALQRRAAAELRRVDGAKVAAEAAAKAAADKAIADKAVADAADKAAADKAAAAAKAAADKAAADAAAKAAADKAAADKAAAKPAPVAPPVADTPHEHTEDHEHAPVSSGTGHGNAADHSFIYSAAGTPGRWNPCQPIRYQLNLTNAPAGSSANIEKALSQLGQASGLTFQRVGDTTFIPYTTNGVDNINNWNSSDLVIAWAHSNQSTRLVGNTAGLGGPTHMAWTKEGPVAIKKAGVILNADQNNHWTPGFGPGQSQGNLLLHEIGHALGLGHVSSDNEVMGGGVNAGLGKGDKEGLRRLGATQGCLTLQ